MYVLTYFDHGKRLVCDVCRCVDEVVPPGRYNARDIRDVVPLMAGGEKVAQLLGL
jgi:hypothetical protein